MSSAAINSFGQRAETLPLGVFSSALLLLLQPLLPFVAVKKKEEKKEKKKKPGCVNQLCCSPFLIGSPSAEQHTQALLFPPSETRRYTFLDQYDPVLSLT